MKKIILTLSALTLLTTLSIFAINSANAEPKRLTVEERKAKREMRQQEVIGKMKAALAAQSFTFYPTSYTLPFETPNMLYGEAGLYLAFYPEDLDINLPFEINQGNEFTFDTQMADYEDYSVKATKHVNYYIVTAQLEDVSNMGIGSNLSDQDMNIGIHIGVNVATGNATLTLTPDFSAAVTYQGTIHYAN